MRLETESEAEAVRRSLDDARNEKSDLERKVQSLTLKLEGQADYATIKKDLAILKVLIHGLFLRIDLAAATQSSTFWKCSLLKEVAALLVLLGIIIRISGLGLVKVAMWVKRTLPNLSVSSSRLG